MTFNWEINLGTILSLVTILIVALGAFNKLGKLEAKLNIMFDWFQSVIIHREPPDENAPRRFHLGD